jgi:hypothetical protein
MCKVACHCEERAEAKSEMQAALLAHYAESAPAMLSAAAPPTINLQPQPTHPYRPVISFTVGMLCHLVVQGERTERGLDVRISTATQTRLSEYVTRILDKSSCPSECFPTALLFLSRLRQCQNFEYNRENICVMFATAVILASKWLEDIVLGMTVRHNSFSPSFSFLLSHG